MAEIKKDCIRFRQEYEDRPSDQPGSAREHVDNCLECRTWAEQTADILEIARNMPQFDVPESLTQKILAGVKSEHRAEQTRKISSTVCVLTALAGALLIMDSDSLNGCLSWAISLAVLVVIGFVIGNGDREHKAA